MCSLPSRAAIAPLALLVVLSGLLIPNPVRAQDEAPDPELTPTAAAGLPIFATLGFAFGQRRDACALCPSPEDNESFAAHLSLGKYLAYGIGVGVDGSVWRRNRPAGSGVSAGPDIEGPAALTNTLGNASLVFSVQRWHVFVRGGGGIAWGRQDTLSDDVEGETGVVTMSGMGVGYTVGAGLTLPLHPMISLAFFGNYNVGLYDLSSPEGSIFRDAKHEVVELGIGLSLR